MHRKTYLKSAPGCRAASKLGSAHCGSCCLVPDQAMVVDGLEDRIRFPHIFKVMSTESAYDADCLPPGTSSKDDSLPEASHDLQKLLTVPNPS